MTTDTPITIRLDASALKKASCLRRLYLSSVLGYRPRGTGEASQMLYGTCFHYFAEELERRGPAASHAIMTEVQLKFATGMTNAIVPKGKDYMDVMHLTSTCLRYMKYRADTESTSFEILRSPLDGTPLVEIKFSLPLAIIGRYEFLLQGTIDRIARVRNGCLCLRDFKTTSLKDPTKYFMAEKMSPQMKTYSFAVQRMAEAFPDGLFGRLLKDNPAIGCFIDGVFLDPKDPATIQASPADFHSDRELDGYHRWVLGICSRLAAALDSGEWPDPEGTYNDTCRSAFGSYCTFLDVCLAKQEWSASQAILDRHFIRKDYEPLTFGGGKKAEQPTAP